MGMDLIPRNPDCPPHHFNWTGWRVIGDLLADTGADLSGLAGTNDGDFVSETTAAAWAEALESCLDHLVVVVVPDETYMGGERTHLRVLAAQLRDPTAPVTEIEERIAESGDFPHVAERLERQRRVVPTTRDPSDDDVAWVKEFVTFLRHSGGFEQW
jgi:hypothetical protein